MNLSQQTNQGYSELISLKEHGRKNVLNEIAENCVGGFFLSKTEQKGWYPAHSLTIAYSIIASSYSVEDISHVDASDMLIFHILLDAVEEFLHGVIENTEVSSASNNIFLDDFNFLDKFPAASVKIIQKMLVFEVIMTWFFPI